MTAASVPRSFILPGLDTIMGRRRLALRQVEERADPDVSDLESDQELAADAAAPNFSLLLAPAAPPSAVDHQQHQHLGDDSDQVIAPTAPSVFKLYQDGLTPEQPLQLAFLRRRVRCCKRLLPRNAI